jgi:hypothetical protein
MVAATVDSVVLARVTSTDSGVEEVRLAEVSALRVSPGAVVATEVHADVMTASVISVITDLKWEARTDLLVSEWGNSYRSP